MIAQMKGINAYNKNLIYKQQCHGSPSRNMPRSALLGTRKCSVGPKIPTSTIIVIEGRVIAQMKSIDE